MSMNSVIIGFVLWPHDIDSLHELHHHFNQQHPSIQFKREDVSNYKIAFLDVLVFRTKNGISPLHITPPRKDILRCNEMSEGPDCEDL